MVVERLVEQYRENKMNHAFIIQTNNKEKSIKDILCLLKQMSCDHHYKNNCKDCFICHQIDNQEFPGIFIVKAEGKTIKKEQITELKRKLSFKPLFSKFLAYIIVDADKLNASSTNSMLKFLEEPESDVYGFLITNSKENLLPTIQSRCQTENMYFDEDDVFSSLNIDEEKKQEYLSVALDYVRMLSVENDKVIMYNKDVILDKYNSISDIEILFKVMHSAYEEALKIKSNIITDFTLGDFSIILNDKANVIIKKLRLITDGLNNLAYNLNLELMLDRFVIEMGEVNE